MNADIRERAHNAFPRWFANGIVDHKAWCKRIIERERLGDKTLSVVQVRFAHEAMDVVL